MNSNCMTTTGSLNISLREGRLMLDRALLQTGLPYGFIGAVREAVLTSEGLGLGGFQHFLNTYESLKRARPDAIRLIEDEGQRLVADCGGQQAWIVAQTLLDLLIDEARNNRLKSMRVRHVSHARELEILAALGQRLGATIQVQILQEGTEGVALLQVLALQLPPKEISDDVLQKVISRGLPVEAQLWWRIYHLALDALTPDTVVSRRHAGANYIDANGNLVGRLNDDDTDFSLLKAPNPAPAAAISKTE